MSKTAKIWLIVAVCLVIVGAIMFSAVMTAYHWDFSKLGTQKFETNIHEIKEDFTNLKLNTETADILFAKSSDNNCKVVCNEQNSMKHSVVVKDDTLNISIKDEREWYEYIGINFQTPKITVYLPKDEYSSLAIKGSTGDVEISDKIKVESADISISTGDIMVKNMSADKLNLSLSTGDIFVFDVICNGGVKANLSTGDIKLSNVMCRDFISKGSTSDIFMDNVIAAEKLSVERSTGDVVLDKSDAKEIFIKTGTGDVTGSLLNEKVFITETSTGEVNVPKTITGGKCEIVTSTGDIIIKILK